MKHLLVENELKKLQKFDSSYFISKDYFDDNGTQNYLVFQPMNKYFKVDGNYISEWKSKVFSDEVIKSDIPTGTSSPVLSYFGTKKGSNLMVFV